MMAETVGREVFEWLEKDGGEWLLVFFLNFKDFLGGLERLIALRMTDFSKNEAGGGGGGETNLNGHGAGT